MPKDVKFISALKRILKYAKGFKKGFIIVIVLSIISALFSVITPYLLGLITTKKPELEDKDKVIARIHEAEKYIPLERLCLSPQCGFASCEIGNKITEEQQWAKLALVKEIAEEVWK